MIKTIILTQAHPGIPHSDKLIGIEIPLAQPFNPNINPRFVWDEKTGKTLRDVSMSVKMTDLLTSLKNICIDTHDYFKAQHLNSTLTLQSKYCTLSR